MQVHGITILIKELFDKAPQVSFWNFGNLQFNRVARAELILQILCCAFALDLAFIKDSYFR